ncbi:anti-sigma factor domain-containing protein [Pelotomaculum terephthalicicum JT]|uniref:anti-sigma factor domain-containing protein n=1 Tax=Pelotomaculum terephthalicicum TaxID=206393 RepID=UPI001F04C560|nr:anti-sigma factor domain-containing protein [Pelotomaculum terephthalicicum]MCG9969028.1 anti-sigma factor domain-containing protein [Pelotomaculum terephthalicicum JT]
MVYEGTVITLKKRSAVVMTGDCQFKEIKRTPATLSGFKVRFTDEDLFQPAVKAPLRFAAVAASLLVCFVLAYSLLQGIAGARTFAYIGLEVNPALEISLDQEMMAIKVTGLNEDGREVAKGLRIQGQDAGEAVQTVLAACAASGYLNSEHNQVLMATTFSVKNDKQQEELDYRIWIAARQAVAANQGEASVHILNADPALRKQAVKQGVSAGRYLLWQDAQSSGSTCDLDSPLSSPAFSRSAGRLSLPFTESDSAVPGPALHSIPSERTEQAPSSPSPGVGTAPGNPGNSFNDRITTPGAGNDANNGKDTGGNKPDNNTGNANPAAPGEAKKANNGSDNSISGQSPLGGVKDNKYENAAKPANNAQPAENSTDKVKDNSTGNVHSRSQEVKAGSAGGNSGSGSVGRSSNGNNSGSGGNSSGSGGGSGGKGGGKK